MEPVTGIFKTRADAQRAITELQAGGISPEDISLLTPQASEDEVHSIPVADTEQPGMGKALGSVVGGAVGAATGLSLGAAAASIFIPAVGPVIAVGLLGAALFGTGGAVGGAIAGEALEQGMDEGLPVDEMFVYEDALRKGRSVVVVLAKDSFRADVAREVMRQTGTESVDAAREDWWLGLRDAEEESYTGPKEEFGSVERDYRSGFEAALRPQLRGKTYQDSVNYLMATYPQCYSDSSFRRGYERGQSYYQSLIAKNKSSD
jgi:outer membrane lipoprotein SlyB